MEDLPFDELPGCDPRALIMGGTVDIAVSSYVKDGANVVEWLTELGDTCPRCMRNEGR